MSCITRIRFQSKDEENEVKYFWIKPKIPYQANDAENLAKNYAISEKISAYSKRRGVEVNSLRFTFDIFSLIVPFLLFLR
jgi:hypothetical protein